MCQETQYPKGIPRRKLGGKIRGIEGDKCSNKQPNDCNVGGKNCKWKQ